MTNSSDEEFLDQYRLVEEEGEENGVELENTPLDGEETRVRLKRKVEELEWLECPVCMETPRAGPIYSCRKGHIICRLCQPKISQCPTCRDKFIDCRSLIAEKLLTSTLKDTPMQCRYHLQGCVFQDLVISLPEHEASCMYRTVKCPANHRGACFWEGSLNKLIQHVIQKKCAQVVKSKPPSYYFVSTIGDFAQDQTVFNKNTTTHWKPVMLISQDALRFFCYAIFYRDSGGIWYCYVRSFAPTAISDTLRVEIGIGRPGSEDNTQYVFRGGVSSSIASEQEVTDNGNYLLLRDGQVKKFKVDKIIMEYRISLTQLEAPALPQPCLAPVTTSHDYPI